MTAQTLRHPGPHLALAFLGMGAWAAFANRAHPWPGPLLAGLVQGCLSAVLTLVMKRLIEAVVARTGVVAPAAAALACGALSLSVLAPVHALAGTPEIAATLAVPLMVSTAYAATYALALRRMVAP